MNIKTKMIAGVAVITVLLLGFLMYLRSYTNGAVSDLEGMRDHELALANAAWSVRYYDQIRNSVLAEGLQTITFHSRLDGETGTTEGNESSETIIVDGQEFESTVLSESVSEAVDQRGDLTAIYESSNQALRKAISFGLANSSGSALGHLEHVKATEDKVLAASTKLIGLLLTGQIADSEQVLINEYKPTRDEFLQATDAFFQNQESSIQQSIANKISDTENARNTSMVILGTLILAIGGIATILAQNIATRVQQLTAISNRISEGEIDGLNINLSGKDEISQLGESMNGVVAAFEVLYQQAEAVMAQGPALREVAAAERNDEQ